MEYITYKKQLFDYRSTGRRIPGRPLETTGRIQ